MTSATRLQAWRRATQAGFFVLFVLAPWLDLFRYDLTTGHAWILMHEWHLGLDPFLAGHLSAGAAAGRVLVRLFLPLLGLAALVLLIAWRWGRLYCGWLCPHFSVVETINRALARATGRQSLWDREAAHHSADGREATRQPGWWLVVFVLVPGFACAWAIVFLSYLLPPAQVYGDLLHLSPTRGEAIFLAAASGALTLEFLLARHLFCRYACAVGMFQSLAWMGNRRALAVGVDRARSAACATCLPGRAFACEQACPMRLPARALKRRKFACTQCGECIVACHASQARQGEPSLLDWVDGDSARRESGFGTETSKDGR